MNAVLVCGGAGYIGSHVCKALAANGFRPVVLDTLEKGHDWAVRWGPLVQGDVGDKSLVERVLQTERPRAVVHLAGYIEVGESVRQPQRFWDNNVERSRILIRAAIDHRIEAFLFSSTCAVYGTPRGPLVEDHPFAPESPYGETKLAVERLLARAAPDGLRSVSLRYFNATGAEPDDGIGEAHQPETHLVPLTIQAALGLTPPLTIFGTDYDTPDGTCLRDYVHVVDIADAHVRSLNALLGQRIDLTGLAPVRSGPADRAALLAADNTGDVAAGNGCHLAFNLGSGTGYSVRQVVDTVGRVVGRPVPHTTGPRRPGDPPRLVGSIAKAQRLLGWQPRRDLARQIADAARWIEQQRNRLPA